MGKWDPRKRACSRTAYTVGRADGIGSEKLKVFIFYFFYFVNKHHVMHATVFC